MDTKKLIFGMAPWFLFTVAVHRMGVDGAGLAAVASCLAAAGLAAYELSRGHSVKILDWAGVATFGLMAMLAYGGGPVVEGWLVGFGRGGSTLVLAAVMAVSAVTVPFTEQYARESVDPRYWGSPVFRAKNKAISLVWAGAVAAMGVGHVLAGVLGAQTGPVNLVLNWALPVAMIIFAVNRSRAIVDAGKAPATIG